MRELIIGTLVPLLVPVLSTGLLWLLAEASRWLSAKGKASKAAAVVSSSYELVRAVVEHVERHIRPEVVKALEDGQLTQVEADALKAKALELAKEAIGQQGLAKLRGLFGDKVDLVLSGWIEKALRETRVEQRLAMPPLMRVGPNP